MIKIAYIRLGRAFGGVESYLMDLMANLPSDCSALALLRGEQTIEVAQQRDLEVITIKKTRKLDFRLLSRLPKYLRAHPTDIIHSQGELSDFFAARAKAVNAVPFHVITLHTFPETDFSLGRVKLFLYRWMNRYSWKRADRIVVVYQGRAGELIDRGVPPEKIRVIYNGIDPELFQKRPDGRLSKEFGLSSDSRLIGSIGRLVPEKGQDRLIKSFASLSSQAPDLFLLIVGGGPELANLTKQVHRLGLDKKILFLGERRDIPEILASLELYLLPSLTEAFPVGLLEAMAAGKPVVAPRIGGVPEVISDGRNGLLVKPGDPGELQAAISRLLSDREKAELMGNNARETVKERFTAKKMAEATAQLYSELIIP